MADPEKSPNIGEGIRFEKVQETRVLSGGSNRSEAALTVRPSGYSKSNTEMKDWVMDMLDQTDINREKFRVSFGVNKELGVVALYLAKWEEKGAVPVRVSANGLSFHLGGVFYQFPSLRPNTIVESEVTVIKDANGRKCIAFNILSALPKIRSRRRSSTTGSSTATGGAGTTGSTTETGGSGSATASGTTRS